MIFAWMGFLAFTQAAEVRVCATCAKTTIASALKEAKAGDVIHVGAGVYSESPITIDKSISLIGEDQPVLDGGNQNQVVMINKADHVRIQGFIIRNSGMSYVTDMAGVRITESSDCQISKNTFRNTVYGVYLENSKSCQVVENDFEGDAKDEASSGNGVHVWYGGSHEIEGNRVRRHRDGIYLEFSSGTKVRHNVAEQNLRYGLHFMSSHDTLYEANRFAANGSGVAVMYSRRIKMVDNVFEKSVGTAAFGLLMKEVFDSEVLGNQFRNNTVGIYMEGSNRNQLSANLINESGWGLRIMGDCEDNTVKGNDFMSNTFEVATNSDHNWNTFDGNYWSQSESFDRNHDGVGDQPHRPVRLSALLLERSDSAFIFLDSFFFAALDRVEKALPGLTPEPLKDLNPKMRPMRSWQK